MGNQGEEHNQSAATWDNTQHMSRTDVALALAFYVALFATLGALFIGEVMGQMPCVLCWYQRIAMFPLAFILGVAAYRNDKSAIVYALPLSLVGFAIAAWHLGLYIGLIPEPIVPCTENGLSCTSSAMIFLGIPIPIMSLVSFLAIVALLFISRSRNS